MFTLEQIKAAHSKVKTGADFPAYIQDMKKLGVESYEHYVSDGRIDYNGSSYFILSAPPKWNAVAIYPKGQKSKLEQAIKVHQSGKTDYLTFCRQAADAGVEKWVVDMKKMMCTYYDQHSSELIGEPIPEANAYAS